MQLVTSLDEPGKTHFGSRDGRKLQVHYEEGGVSFPAVSVGKASERGSRIVGCQAVLPGLIGEHQTTRGVASNRGVCCLPGMVTETLNGVPLSSNSEMASAVVEGG